MKKGERDENKGEDQSTERDRWKRGANLSKRHAPPFLLPCFGEHLFLSQLCILCECNRKDESSFGLQDGRVRFQATGQASRTYDFGKLNLYRQIYIYIYIYLYIKILSFFNFIFYVI
jgi:hypothetical protein